MKSVGFTLGDAPDESIPEEELTSAQKARRTAKRNRLLRQEIEDTRPCVIRCVCGKTISRSTLGKGREAFRRHREEECKWRPK